MKEHVILLITNRQEVDVVDRHILEYCGIAQDFNIWSYSIPLIKLYNWLHDAGGKNFQECNFIDVVRQREQNQIYKVLCQQQFTEIILSYDLSDLDYDDDREKICELLAYFNDIRGNGRLFIDYPAVEAFYHSEEFIPGEFEKREIAERDIPIETYRMIIGGEIGFPSWNMYNENVIYQLMTKSLRRAYHIIGKQCWPNREQEEYKMLIDFVALFEKQLKSFHNNEKIPILCTSLFIPLEIFGVRRKDLLDIFKKD